MNPIENPSNRRFIAFAVGVFVVAMNKKLGLNLDVADQATLVAFITGYIAQSTVKELKQAALDGQAAAAAVTTPAEALKVMGPQP